MARKVSREKRFAIKISLFNSLGFMLAVGVPTFVDPLLKSHVAYAYGARQYFLGPWVLLLPLFAFFGTYLILIKRRYLFSWFPIAILGAASLWNFGPELPHGNVALWTTIYCITSSVTSWIYCSKVDSSYITDESIHVSARIERIKESINYWRTISIAIAAGYLAILLPWISLLWTITDKFVLDHRERLLLATVWGVELALFSIYVLAGPVSEAFLKTQTISNDLLKIKES